MKNLAGGMMSNKCVTSIDFLFGEKPIDAKTTEPKRSSREGKLIEAFRKLAVNEQKVLLKQIEGMVR